MSEVGTFSKGCMKSLFPKKKELKINYSEEVFTYNENGLQNHIFPDFDKKISVQSQIRSHFLLTLPSMH